MAKKTSLPHDGPRSRTLLILPCILLLLSACLGPRVSSDGGVKETKALAGEPGPNHMLDRMLGQMLMVGFRGATLDENDPIVLDVAQGRVGGVVLFDYDSALKVADRNVKSPEQAPKTHRVISRPARPSPCSLPWIRKEERFNDSSPNTAFPPSRRPRSWEATTL